VVAMGTGFFFKLFSRVNTLNTFFASQVTRFYAKEKKNILSVAMGTGFSLLVK
jgi:hypothetical protein